MRIQAAKYLSGALAIVTVLSLIETGLAQDMTTTTSEDAWSIDFSPYVWLPSIDGDLGVNGVTAPIDLDLGDILNLVDEIKFGFSARVEAHKQDWMLTFDFIGVSLEDDVGGVNVDFDMILFEFGAGYRIGEVNLAEVDEPERLLTFDVLFGGRYMYFDADITIPGQSASGGKDWLEPFIGGRARAQLSDDLTATVRFDFGGFGIGSDQTVSFVGGLQYRISPNATLGAGWRILDIDYDKSGFVFDAKLSGPIVGLTFTF